MNGHYGDTALRSAGHVLFGMDVDLSKEFFFYLQPEGVKAAFRRRARETHPDVILVNKQGQAGAAEAFHRVTEAYQLLCSFVRQRDLDVVPRPAHRHSTHKPNDDVGNPHYHKGELPARRLETGRYLYYLGIIPYQAILSAIVWQRKQRPPLGRIARNWGWLSDEAVRMVLCSRGYTGHFGDKAIRHGLLTRHQLTQLLAHQRSRQQRIGDYFVKAGYLTESEMEQLARQLRNHNARH